MATRISRASRKKHAKRRREKSLQSAADEAERAAALANRRTPGEFEQALSTATIRISSVDALGKAVAMAAFPGSEIGDEVTHVWVETGPNGRSRLHLLTVPEYANTDQVVRLLDVIPRDRLMVAAPDHMLWSTKP